MMVVNMCSCSSTFFLLFCLWVVADNAWGITDEQRLTKNLLKDYRRVGKIARPVSRSNETLPVTLGLTLQAVLNVNRERQSITTLVWFNMVWTDQLLRWDPSKYGGIRSIRLPPEAIYIPDVVPYNEIYGETTRHPTLVVVDNHGGMLWVPPATLTTTCSIMEPRPSQFNCTIKMGSWTYDASGIDLRLQGGGPDISSYVPNPMYELVGTDAKRNVVQYDCCPEKYIDVTFRLTLKPRE